MSDGTPTPRPVAVLASAEIVFTDGDMQSLEIGRCAHIANPVGDGHVLYAFREQNDDAREIVVHSKDVLILFLTPALVDAADG